MATGLGVPQSCRTVSAGRREAIALGSAQANGCDYCQAAHTAIGKNAGLTEQQMVDIRRGQVSDPKLAAITRFAEVLHEKRGSVSDEDLRAFKSAGFNDGHVVEAIATFAINLFTNYFNHVAETEVDFPAVPELSTT